MLVGIGLGVLVVGVLGLAWGIITEFRQQRASGPVALVATYPFAIQAALVVIVGLLALRGRLWNTLPWWGCVGVGAFVGLAGGAVISLAGRLGRARRLPNKPLQRS
jgi:hypothetical protein